LVQLEDGTRVVISLLGAEGKQTRWADINRVLSWLEAERG
jgi:D-alanyl-D-alanine carboxypeptidase